MSPDVEKNKSKNVIIIGGGIVGLATAYELNKEYNVHVIEKQEDVCLGASFQNGGVVNVESIAPVNSYMDLNTTLKKSVFSSLTGKPTNTMIRTAALLEPNLFLWVRHFLINSSSEKILYHSEGMRQIGAAITPLMEDLFKNLSLDRAAHNFHYTTGLLLRNVENSSQYVHKKKEMFGQVFPKRYVIDTELEIIQKKSGILGLEDAKYNVGCVEPNNITVNTKKLGESLKQYLTEMGVKFSFSKEATLVVDDTGTEIGHVQLENKEIVRADDYVVCAGYSTTHILKSIGLRIPLMPIKAYSLHIKNPRVASKWKYAVHIDAEVAGLFTPYREVDENSLRVTGIRDLDGSNPVARPERVDHLIKVARTFTGSDWNTSNMKVWCGIMPLSPDDFPVIGRTQKFSNLYINAGHGFRGTAYSLPSARLLLQIMMGDEVTCFERKFADPTRFHL